MKLLTARPLLAFFSTLLLLSATAGAPTTADREQAARWKAWRADLDYLYKEIERPIELRQIFKVKGIDWKRVKKDSDALFKREQLAAKKHKNATQKQDEASFYGVLRHVIGHLRDSHASVEVAGGILDEWNANQAPSFDAGIEFLPGTHGMILVANTFAARAANSPLYQKGVRHEQTRLKSVNGTPAAEYFEALAKMIREERGWQSTYDRAYIEALNGLAMQEDGSLKLVFETLDAAENLKQKYLNSTPKQRSKEIKRLKWKSKKVSLRANECEKSQNARNFRFLALEFPEMQGTIDPAIYYGKLPSGTGYVRYLGVSGTSRAGLEEACDALEGCSAMILDMRINGGGGESGIEVFDAERGPWNKPLAVLIGPKAMSAAETELWTLLQMREARKCNARLFGRTTAGSSGAKFNFRLPSGFAEGRFVVRHWHGGRSQIEGVGIAPDEVVDQDIVELSLGIDSCIRAAEAWIAEQ